MIQNHPNMKGFVWKSMPTQFRLIAIVIKGYWIRTAYGDAEGQLWLDTTLN